MAKTVEKDLKKSMKAYIEKLLRRENIQIKNVLYGMRKTLSERGAITEGQWNTLVKFMMQETGKGREDLRKRFEPVIGHDYRRDDGPINTLEEFLDYGKEGEA